MAFLFKISYVVVLFFYIFDKLKTKVMTKEEMKEYKKQYYLDNKEKIKEQHKEFSKQYRVENKEKLKEKSKQYRLENKEKIKQYLLNNKEKIKEQQKKYNEENKEKLKEYHIEYNKNNKDLLYNNKKVYYLNNPKKYINRKEGMKVNIYNRRKEDPLFKLSGNIRCLIKGSIKNNGYNKSSKTYNILGCSFEDFKQHLEKQFTDGMNWSNQGQWHLDHIYPVSRAEDEAHLIKLNHYTNFQPLWAIDNIKKSNKLPNQSHS